MGIKLTSAALDALFICFKSKPFFYSERPRLVYNYGGYSAMAIFQNWELEFQTYQFRYCKTLKMCMIVNQTILKQKYCLYL